MVGGVLKMAKALCQKRGQRFLFFVIFFVITISENYITNTAVIILLLYGYVFRSTYRGKRYVHALGEREAEGANLS